MSLSDAERFKLLFGPYRSPRCRVGKRLRCVLRGELVVRGISDALIPWPQAKSRWGRMFLIVCGDLVKAVRRESVIAVAHWWGVSDLTVWTWRKALGVGATTEGTSRLRREYFSQPWAEEARERGWAKARDPEHREKIAAAKRGKPRPPHVIDAVRRAHTGKRHSPEARRKMSEAQRRRGTWPPAAGKAWEPWEDELVRTLPRKEVARRTGRTVGAITGRRQTLGLPNGRRREHRRPSPDAAESRPTARQPL
jgi:hypothetical protein